MPKQGTSTSYHQLLSRGAIQNPCRRLEKQWKTEGRKSCTTMNKGPRDGVEPGEGFSCPSSFLRLGDWEERSVRGAARLCLAGWTRETVAPFFPPKTLLVCAQSGRTLTAGSTQIMWPREAGVTWSGRGRERPRYTTNSHLLHLLFFSRAPSSPVTPLLHPPRATRSTGAYASPWMARPEQQPVGSDVRPGGPLLHRIQVMVRSSRCRPTGGCRRRGMRPSYLWCSCFFPTRILTGSSPLPRPLSRPAASYRFQRPPPRPLPRPAASYRFQRPPPRPLPRPAASYRFQRPPLHSTVVERLHLICYARSSSIRCFSTFVQW